MVRARGKAEKVKATEGRNIPEGEEGRLRKVEVEVENVESLQVYAINNLAR